MLVESSSGNLVGSRETSNSCVQSLCDLLINCLGHTLIHNIQIIGPLIATIEELLNTDTSSAAVSGGLDGELLVSKLEHFVTTGQSDTGNELLSTLSTELTMEYQAIALSNCLNIGEHTIGLKDVLRHYVVQSLSE